MSALAQLKIDKKVIENLSKKKLSDSQEQTKNAFAFEWSKLEAYESEAHAEVRRKWMLEKYCDNTPAKIDEWLEGEKKIILDAGCGSGYASLIFWREHLKKHYYLGVDISDAVETGKLKFKQAGYDGDFLQCNLLDLPVPDNSMDIIFSEGVLHHTDSTEQTLKYLSTKLKKGGRFLFYVYAKKAVMRELADDHIRNSIRNLTDAEAWEALKPLTKLGIALGELNSEIDIKEDIPYLGIKKGKIDLQRFFYWNFFKAYYRKEFSLEEMNLLNFDWYRPMNCHRHTKEEVESFCKNSNLEIENMNVQEAGITVVARKK